MSETIPFVDLYAQYKSIKREIDQAIKEVIKNSAFIRGKFVEKFEEEFSSEIGVEHCISCANGTDALYITMKALGVSRNDEVIVPAHSWISTSESVSQAGGKVIFCDTELDTFTIDPKKIVEKITKNTVGIVPVHLYGQSANMTEIIKIAKKYKLWVIEDCAQSHLAKHAGQMTGTFGNAATFSFYPGKNLGAMGDAGAILTNDLSLAEKMTMFARHGGLKKGDHNIEGINSRLDGLQAAILSVKLKQLKNWTIQRREIASFYNSKLLDINQIKTPSSFGYDEHVYHLYVIKAEKRDALAAHLKKRHIETIINYPVSLPFLKAYERLKHSPKDFPTAFSNQSKILSLPIYPEIKKEHKLRIVNCIKEFYCE